MPELSIIVPCYRKADVIVQSLHAKFAYLDGLGITYELIAVVDGMADDTLERIRGMSHAGLRVVVLEQNRGKGRAVRAGFRVAEGTFIGYIDADEDIDPKVIGRMLEAVRGGADIAYPNKYRADSQAAVTPLRRVLSRVYSRLIGLLFGIAVADTQTGAKLYRREVLEAVLPQCRVDRFAFEIEIFALAAVRGFGRFSEVPVEISRRGQGTVRPATIIPIITDMVSDTLGVFFRLRVVPGSLEATPASVSAESSVWRFLADRSASAALACAVIGSALLMAHTVGYGDGAIRIAGKAWSDFLSHVPLIRSFTVGAQGWPVEYPLFAGAGEPIRYHFLFYALVGWLERIGFRFDIALNLLSVAGFAGLLMGAYWLGWRVSGGKRIAAWVAMLAVPFNASLSWLYAVRAHGFSRAALDRIVNSESFLAFGPYDDKVISAFWNLNVYTNQRHFAFGMALALLGAWCIAGGKGRRSFWVGVFLFALLAWLHKAALIMALAVLGALWLADGARRARIMLGAVAGLVAAAPGLFLLNGTLSATTASGLHIVPGFLEASTTWSDFPGVTGHGARWLVYWALNAGILLPLAAVGWWFADARRPGRSWQEVYRFVFSPSRAWAWAAVATFTAANLIRFTPDPSGNHKFINFAFLIGGAYAGVALAHLAARGILRRAAALVLFVALTLGGVCDLFPIINDTRIPLPDAASDTTVQWIVQNTQPTDRILNTTYDLGPLSVSGRRVAYGWDYFAWSVGHEMGPRKNMLRRMITGQALKTEVCWFLGHNRFAFIAVPEYEARFVDDQPVNREWFMENFVRIDPGGLRYAFYDAARSCTPLLAPPVAP